MDVIAFNKVFPRNGRNISLELLVDGLENVIGSSSSVNSVFIKGSESLRKADGSLDLNALRLHNAIEHDASLVHQDGPLSWVKDQSLVEDMMSFSKNGVTLNSDELGRYRRKRTDYCKDNTPGFTYGFNQEFLAISETSFVLLFFGNGETANVADARSWLGEERIPASFVPKSMDTRKEVGFFDVLGMNGRIKSAAGWL